MRIRFHYGWVVVGVTFLTLLVSAGVRSAPTVLVHPLEDDLGWHRASISFAISIGLLLYGLSGPFSGLLMGRFGPRRLMLAGLALIGVSTVAGAAMTAQWQVVFCGHRGGVSNIKLDRMCHIAWRLTASRLAAIMMADCHAPTRGQVRHGCFVGV